MDVKEVYFDDEDVALDFVDNHWNRTFNISFNVASDAGRHRGWVVRLLSRATVQAQAKPLDSKSFQKLDLDDHNNK